MTEYISVKQMADKLNIKKDKAYELVHISGFPAYKLGKSIRISVEKLEKWLEKRKIIN